MDKKTVLRLNTTLLAILVIMVIYTIVTMASIGRFSNTHAITAQSYCTDCHISSLTNLDNGRHVGAMGVHQSSVIDSYFEMVDTTNISSRDVNGLCMSCHNIRAKDFGLVDPYFATISSGNGTSNVSTTNGIIFWNPEWDTNIINGGPNETITVSVKVQNVIPTNTSVAVDTTIQLMNFSGKQYGVTCDCITTLYEGDTQIVDAINIYADYFKVYIDVNGEWSFSSLNVSVNGYPSVIINSSGSSPINFYNLPADLPSEYSHLNFFHTTGNYTVIRMDRVINDMRNSSVESISLNNEIMKDYATNNSLDGYTCSSEGALCHINQKIVYMGQRDGIRKERYYSHDMEYSTNVCKNCHL